MTFKNNFISKYFKTRRAFATILLVALFFGLGVYIGFNKRPEINKVENLFGKETAVATEADFSPFWKVWNNINEKYPNASKISDQDKIYGAISGLVDSLDDSYSVFFKPDEAKLFEDDIKSGDKILKINDLTTSGLSVEKAIKLIRGDVGTTVTLTILHEGEKEPKEIKIVRDIINIPTLDTELRKDGIFVIKLYSFSANSTNLFRKALKEFSLAQSDKLLLDLRGNPGGYLDAAVSMSSWFLEGGKTVVTEDYGNNTNPKIYRSQGYNIFSDKLKFAILIDNGSASASEIFAGAMQDYKKAFLIGEKSYGKGSVQEVVKVTPDTILKITVAKWLTPNGNSISEKGLIPDYEILITKKDLEEKMDPQLNKAVELLNNWPKK